ncbi:hypothetical protein D3C86_603350 [compost metagenome]
MQYDVTTPEAYLEALEPDWRRETLLQLRGLIQAQAPELVEGIDYKMLSYRDATGIVFGLNAQKHYVSFYVGNASTVDPDGSLLAGLDHGKGCIRFKKSVTVSKTPIDAFIARAAELNRRGVDTGC